MAVYRKWELVRDGFTRCGFFAGNYGTATAGSTTTITDTSKTYNANTKFKGGLAMILRDAGGANAAPEGEFSEITSLAAGVFTFSPAVSAAVAAGDRYVVSQLELDYDEIHELVNDALTMFDIPKVDESLTSGENQTEYSLPVGIKQNEIRRIYYQGQDDDSNDNQWIEVLNWRVEPAGPGSAGTLILPQLPSGRVIQIMYRGKHARVETFSDVISEYIDPELARRAFVERIRNRQDQETQSGSPNFRRMYDKAAAELEEAKRDFPIWMPSLRVKLLNVPEGYG